MQSRSQASALTDLAECKQKYDRFELIFVVGHSNVSGIRLAPEVFVRWEAFARWLAPFRPKRVVLAACEAGGWLAAQHLFREIVGLQELYGSPAMTTPKQVGLLKAMIPFLLLGRRVDADALKLAQIGNFAFTGGVLFRQRRVEFRRAGPSEAVRWTGMEALLKVARQWWLRASCTA